MTKNYMFQVDQRSSGMEGDQFIKYIAAEDGTEFKAIAFRFPFGIKTLVECIEDDDFHVAIAFRM